MTAVARPDPIALCRKLCECLHLRQRVVVRHWRSSSEMTSTEGSIACVDASRVWLRVARERHSIPLRAIVEVSAAPRRAS